MPYIQARLSVQLEEAQKNVLQSKLNGFVSDAFGKPVNYIMTEIKDNCSLCMAGKNSEKAAYVSISLLGSAAKEKCNIVTQKICNLMASEYGIIGSNVYVTFHPTDLWGWNGMMF